MQRLDQVPWRTSPSGLASYAVEADPSVPGAAYSLLLKLPDGFWIPPHWHPLDKRVVVLAGVLLMGSGDRVDASAATALPVGGFVLVPARSHHYEGARGETVLLLYGTGPLQTNFLEAPARPPTH